VGQKNSCAGCHTGDFSPFVEEWAQSGHGPAGTGNPIAVNNSNTSCRSCHEGRAVLRAWGVTANYVERDDAVTVANRIPQACGVCHDPHSADNAGQLRFPIDVADVNLNLCMKCHQRRAEPDPASSSGPHSPQGPMLLGEAGYLPAGFDPDVQAIASTHGSSGNPRLCAGCHVNSYSVTDGSGQVTFQSTGHLFRPIPCLDAQGRPQADNSCAYTAPTRAWNSCTTAGCHATPSVAAAAFAVSRQRMIDITNEIWADLNGNNAIDANPTDGGLLSFTAIIPTSGAGNQYVTNDALITPAEGARFNVRMLRDDGADGSKGVHNPFFAEAVLRANISELRTAYPGLPLLSPTVQAIMEGPLGAITQRPLTRPLINPAKLRRQ
jgi:predicted CXXCH cytochrome family protein